MKTSQKKTSRAKDILRLAHTAGQTRKAAQHWCASMIRDHRADTDIYRFTDGSSITITGNRVSLC